MNIGNKLNLTLILKEGKISYKISVLFLNAKILSLDMLTSYAHNTFKNSLFLLLVNLNFALHVVLFMLKNGRIVCMNNFLMLSICISLFLSLLDLLGIFSFFNILKFANLLMLRILLLNTLLRKLEYTNIINIHAIVTYGGFDINSNWKIPKSLPWIVC